MKVTCKFPVRSAISMLIMSVTNILFQAVIAT
jgi:hypothetical protein